MFCQGEKQHKKNRHESIFIIKLNTTQKKVDLVTCPISWEWDDPHMAAKLRGNPVGPGLDTKSIFAGLGSSCVVPLRRGKYAVRIVTANGQYHLRTCLKNR